jgi:murein L,D-transpeptidase YcbB/YkuD
VIYNPWWEVPESIIKESVGALMRGSPAVAAARGYVLDQGRIRQKPGPSNALGQMKLAMPNPQAIYLHDTPSKRHFALPVRAYSHGCIRVGNALDFAATLLEGSTRAPRPMRL